MEEGVVMRRLRVALVSNVLCVQQHLMDKNALGVQVRFNPKC
jgi:hypothetical protein